MSSIKIDVLMHPVQKKLPTKRSNKAGWIEMISSEILCLWLCKSAEHIRNTFISK